MSSIKIDSDPFSVTKYFGGRFEDDDKRRFLFTLIYYPQSEGIEITWFEGEPSNVEEAESAIKERFFERY